MGADIYSTRSCCWRKTFSIERVWHDTLVRGSLWLCTRKYR